MAHLPPTITILLQGHFCGKSVYAMEKAEADGYEPKWTLLPSSSTPFFFFFFLYLFVFVFFSSLFFLFFVFFWGDDQSR